MREVFSSMEFFIVKEVEFFKNGIVIPFLWLYILDKTIFCSNLEHLCSKILAFNGHKVRESYRWSDTVRHDLDLCGKLENTVSQMRQGKIFEVLLALLISAVSGVAESCK